MRISAVDYTFVLLPNPNNKVLPSWEGLGVGQPMRQIIPYRPYLVALAKKLRNNMTYAEIALWREIKNKKLGVRFSRQIPIDRYIVDFYCKDLKLVIEVDGFVHFEEEKQRKDQKRQTRLESLGVRVMRFSNPDVKNNLGWVLEEIRKQIEMLGPTPDPSQEGSKKGIELPGGEN